MVRMVRRALVLSAVQGGVVAYHVRGQAMAEPSKSGGNGGNCLFRFGLIADIQYCDCDDGVNFSGSERRYAHATVSMQCAHSLSSGRAWP